MDLIDIDNTPQTTKNGLKYYHIRVRKLKGKKYNPLSKKKTIIWEDTYNLIQRYLSVREAPKKRGFELGKYGEKILNREALFLNGRGVRQQYQATDKMIKRRGIQVGLTDIHLHKFRHTAITNMIKKGMDRSEIRKLTFHSRNSNALERYFNITQEEAIDELGEIKTQSQPTPIPQPQPQTQTRETQLINLYQQGLINKQEFMKLMGVSPDNTEIKGYV